MPLALSLFALVASLPLTPTDTNVVGHPSVRAALLYLGADTTDVFVTRNGARQLVTTGVQTSVRTKDGILVVQTNRSPKGVSIDSTTLSATTLAPLRHVEAFPDRQATFSFGGGKVVGTVRDSSGSHAVDVAVSAARLDFSTISQVTSALPLADGYDAVILAYDVSAPMRERAVRFAVAGRERVTWNGREVGAWRTTIDLGTHTVTRWLDARTRRELRWQIAMPNMQMEGITRGP